MSIFGIATVIIDTVTVFVFYMVQHKNVIYAVQEI